MNNVGKYVFNTKLNWIGDLRLRLVDMASLYPPPYRLTINVVHLCFSCRPNDIG